MGSAVSLAGFAAVDLEPRRAGGGARCTTWRYRLTDAVYRPWPVRHTVTREARRDS